MALVVGTLVVAATVTYTVNYARYVGKRRNRAGAIALYVLAALTAGVPVFLYWRANH